MMPVAQSTACYDPCAAENALNGACDPRQAPFFSFITSASVTQPAVGSEVLVEVCDPTLYTQDMWLEVAGLGKLQITEVTTTAIRLLNGCPGPLAVDGNAAPGTVVNGPIVVWPTDYDCTVPDFCADTAQCLEDATELCFPNVPDLGVDTGHFFAGTEEDPCGEMSTSCLRRVPGMTTNGATICFAAPEETTTENWIPAVYEDEDVCSGEGKCLKAREAEAEDGFDIWCGGSVTFLPRPNDYTDKCYRPVVDPDTGCLKFGELNYEEQFAWTSRVDEMAAGNYTFDIAAEALTQGVTLPTGPYKMRVTVWIKDSSSSDIQLVVGSSPHTRSTMPIGSGSGGESGVYTWIMTPDSNDTMPYTINKGGGTSAVAYLTFSAIIPCCE